MVRAARLFLLHFFTPFLMAQDAEVTAVLTHNRAVPYITPVFSPIFRLMYGKDASGVAIIYLRTVFLLPKRPCCWVRLIYCTYVCYKGERGACGVCVYHSLLLFLLSAFKGATT